MQLFRRARFVADRAAYLGRCRSMSLQPTKLRIVFGSQTGTAEAFANDLEFDASANYETEIIDAMNFSVKDLASSPPGTVNALIMAVYGEGEPTDNAKSFMKEMASSKEDLSSCQYAVFGLGNSHCFKDRFNVVAIELEKRLQDKGAKRVLDLGLGDASKNMSAEFGIWKGRLLSALRSPVPVPTALSGTPTAIASTQTPLDIKPTAVIAADIPKEELRTVSISPGMHTVVSPNSAVPLALSARQQAMAPPNRPIFFSRVSQLQQMFSKTDEINSSVMVSYDLKDSRPLNPTCSTQGCSAPQNGVELSKGLQPGDHIGVFAPQSKHVVETFVAAVNLPQSDLDKPLEGISASPSITLRQILTWQIQLTGIIPLTAIKVLHRWANENKMAVTTDHLQNLIDNYDEAIRANRVSVTTVLDMIPLGPTFSPVPLVALLKVLPAISPRLYSMVQNPITDPISVSVLCRLLRYRDGRSCIVNGLCSSYLAERVHINDQAAMFFRESAFHLPTDPKNPVIMIAGGTGIAPFISFLKGRSQIIKEKGAACIGPAYLYFGCRNTDEYMFREELLKHLADGSLSKLVVSFSGRYDVSDLQQNIGHANELIKTVVENITDSVDEDRDTLLQYVQQQGHMYVCGGAGNFGKAVRQSVERIVNQAYPPEEGLAHHDEIERSGVRVLIKQNRYFEDLAD